MKYSISFEHTASIQLERAIQWCLTFENGLEKKFFNSFEKGINYILKNPYKCQIRYYDVRIKFIKPVKFGIHYIIRDSIIYVVGVYHTSEDSIKR